MDAINLADFIRNGEQIRVPTLQQPVVLVTASISRSRSFSLAADRPRAIVRTGSPSPQPTLDRYPARSLLSDAVPRRPDGTMNVNIATATEVDELAGVEPAT